MGGYHKNENLTYDEFIDSTYAYMPVTESELYLKKLDKDKFIKCIISEINRMI